jgi:hypothetical protein
MKVVRDVWLEICATGKYASKTLIIPTDANYYKNHRNIKTNFKIITLAPTCFGSCGNHHQGAVLCLAKSMVFLCSLV